MTRTFKYRIYPSKEQITVLNKTLEDCRMLYNHFLNERKSFWEERKESISRYGQCASLPNLKEERSSLKDIHSQVLQNVTLRVDLAFQAFFSRIKQGNTPGYPRFKASGRYDSFTFPQRGFKLNDNHVKLSKIGNVKINQHRSIEGTIKTLTIKRSPTGKWFATFSCIVEPKILPVSTESVGIDVGIESFATFSNGNKVVNPTFFKKEQSALAKAQRKLSKQIRGTSARAKARKIVARVHERIKNKRHNFIHQESRKIVNKYGLISVEDLSINSMLHDCYFCKSIMDASWYTFLQTLSYKAEEAGRIFVKVNPAYTSQDCSSCGHRQTKKLSDRIHKCSCCDLELDRDHNASINILRLGMQSLA